MKIIRTKTLILKMAMEKRMKQQKIIKLKTIINKKEDNKKKIKLIINKKQIYTRNNSFNYHKIYSKFIIK